jgi:hypothetical protein
MRCYAQISEGVVVNVFSTDEIHDWSGDLIDITDQPEVQVNWLYQDGVFSPPQEVVELPMHPATAALLLQLEPLTGLVLDDETRVEAMAALCASVPLPEPVQEANWRPGEYVTTGVLRSYNQITYKCVQPHVTQTGWEPPAVLALWTVYQSPEPGETLPWVAGETVAVGDKRKYGEEIFECLQAHTTQIGWEPPSVPALWQRIA